MDQSTSPSTGGQADGGPGPVCPANGASVPRALVRQRGRVDLPRSQPQVEEPDLHPVDHSEYVPVADPFLRSIL